MGVVSGFVAYMVTWAVAFVAGIIFTVHSSLGSSDGHAAMICIMLLANAGPVASFLCLRRSRAYLASGLLVGDLMACGLVVADTLRVERNKELNTRQRWILILGVAATVLVPVLGTTWLHPPVVGHQAEYAPGRFSVEMTDAVTPKWAVLVSLGVAALTAVSVYKSRTQDLV